MRNGDLAPLHATSGGKCLLAFLPQPMIDEYINNVEFDQITPNTIASKEELRRQLNTIIKERIAYSFEEFTLGIIGMAVPILAEADRPIGSINIAMPAVRYNSKVRDNAADQLERAALTIRHQLGLGEPPRKPGRQRSKRDIAKPAMSG
jgi:DNA-binding IclR family transcriptional regulator